MFKLLAFLWSNEMKIKVKSVIPCIFPQEHLLLRMQVLTFQMMASLTAVCDALVLKQLRTQFCVSRKVWTGQKRFGDMGILLGHCKHLLITFKTGNALSDQILHDTALSRCRLHLPPLLSSWTARKQFAAKIYISTSRC